MMTWNGSGFTSPGSILNKGASLGSGLLPVSIGLMGLNSLLNVAQTALSFNSTNRQNSLNQEAYEYNRELNEQLWAREDTAVQRRAEDLKAAGFNPLLAVDSAASSGAGGMLTAPDVQSPTIRNGALEQLQSLIQAKEADNAQKQLDAAMRQADDEHSMALKQQELADQQYRSLALSNQNQAAENAYQTSLLEQKLQEGQTQIEKYQQEIELLRKQTQTEGTKVALNQAETSLKEAQAEQQRQETAVYSTYEPLERATKLNQLITDYEESLSQRSRNAMSFEEEMKMQQIEREIKSVTLSIAQHDLPLLTSSTLPSSIVENGEKSFLGKLVQDGEVLTNQLFNDLKVFFKSLGLSLSNDADDIIDTSLRR